MENSFKISVKISLILVYLVIAAGSIVRMTGSGMGCPDWPKCFGYWIPPTERTQLDWKPGHQYTKGQVIILKEELRVANGDFESSITFKDCNWGFYTQHDYALFNVYETWIEYLNRLLGAVAGLAVLIMAILSFWKWKKNISHTFVSILILLGMGFQAWLGKTVVDSNLAPYRVSLHMGMALLILLGLVLLLFSNQKKAFSIPGNITLKVCAWFAVLLTLFQIGLGTQVRQFVDLQMHEPPDHWLNPAPIKFYVHRTLSLMVLGVHIIIFWMMRKMKRNVKVFNQILLLIGLEIFTGVLMFYLDFPFSSQPLHLIIAALLFGAQSFFILQIMSNRKSYDL